MEKATTIKSLWKWLGGTAEFAAKKFKEWFHNKI
jgi:hypothetical protein